MAKLPGQLLKKLPSIIEDLSNELSGLAREVLGKLLEEYRDIEKRIGWYDERLAVVFKENEVCQRLAKIPGVGPITATAIFAMAGNASE